MNLGRGYLGMGEEVESLTFFLVLHEMQRGLQNGSLEGSPGR